jgi:predicted N-formylglutamate amidohydrolase
MTKYGLDHFGNKAVFDGQQAIVVEALHSGYVELFTKNVLLEVRNDELERQLREQKEELNELQGIVDASIASLDFGPE